MTSQSRDSHTENTDIEDDVILISPSSSEDEGEHILNTLSFIHDSPRDERRIQELVCEGKRLLALAEVKSRPEEYRNDATVFRYNFSSCVTARDLFRDIDLAELADIVSALKTRLSAERVFSLGLPQLRSEQDVFDELLMRFSDDLLERSRHLHSITTSAESASEIVNPGTLPTDHAGASSSVDSYSRTNNSVTMDHPNPLTQSLHNLVSYVPANPPEIIADELQNGRLSRAEGEHQTAVVSTSFPESENEHLPKDINVSALKEFLKNVDELNSLTSQIYRAVSNKSCDPMLYRVFQALQSSLSAVMRTSSTDSNLQQSEDSSPTSRSGKRGRSEEGCSEIVKKSKTEGIDTKQDDEDKEEDICSICLEPWSTGGDHRITCLKCGHLFGRSCITKWIEQARSCPQCKEGARKHDIRNIFVQKITAEDTSERDRAMRQLEEEKLAKRNFEQKEAMARMKLEMQEADIDSLRAEINHLKAQVPENGRSYGQSQFVASRKATGSTSSNQTMSSKRFQQLQKVPISPDGQCRVFDHCREQGLLVVSLKSPSTLFRGYGIRILTRDFRPLSYQPLHTAAIRDMSFRPGTLDGTLLSCGLDKCLQLTSVTSQVVVQKYTVSSLVWCCAWNTQNTNLFYAGMDRGVVKEFDIRRTDSHVQDILDYGGSPITSLHYWNGLVNQLSLQGLLIAHLQSLIFGEHSNGQLKTHELPHQQAPLMSLSLHPSGMYMSSFRPGTQFPKTRYEICNLKQSNLGDDVSKTVSSSCQAVWEGSNMQAVISRNSLITRPETEDGILGVTANHANNTVNIWDFNRKQDFQTLPCSEKAIDIKLLTDNLLGVLTDKNLLLYNWRA